MAKKMSDGDDKEMEELLHQKEKTEQWCDEYTKGKLDAEKNKKDRQGI